jgi:hypothetical protein
MVGSVPVVTYFCIYMRISIPGQDKTIRLFERVTATDSQYDIFDVGLEYEDGSIDSIAVGGSFTTAKAWVRKLDEAKQKKEVTNVTPIVATVA